MEYVEEQFEKLYPERNGLLSLVTDEQLLTQLKITHSSGLECIDFIKNKIRVCKDALKFNEEDIVGQEELKQYEFALFTLKFCDTLVVEQIQERSK